MRTQDAEGKLIIPLSIYADMERHDKILSVNTKFGTEAMLRMQGGIIYNQVFV